MSKLFPAEPLAGQIRALSLAGSPSEVFKLLLEGARLGAPRAAVFLIRQGQIKGWGSVGYPPEVVQRQRSFTSPAEAGWLGGLASSHEATSALRAAAGQDPDFGQPPPDESVAYSVRVKQRAIALLLAERTGDEDPWFPSGLEMLVTVAQLRLDLDLLQRKLGVEPAKTAPPRAEPIPPAASPAASPVSEPVEAIPPETGAPTGPAGAPGADDPQYDAARRYARPVATDIRLYNEDGDLVDRLSGDLSRGKETFLKRHGDLGEVGLQILHDAYVQVLAGGDGELLPESVVC
jgi:hypothetical protein